MSEEKRRMWLQSHQRHQGQQVNQTNQELLVDYLKKLKDLGGRPQVDLQDYQEVKVAIRADKNVPPALFKPDPLLPGGYIAHPSTIKAMRRDIFVVGNDLDELTQEYQCECCKKQLDLQFWNLCPFCETPFKK